MRIRLHVLEILEEGLRVAPEVESVVCREDKEATEWHLHDQQITYDDIIPESIEVGDVLKAYTIDDHGVVIYGRY